MPQDELFTIIRNEPRVDMFMAYVSGRLLNDDKTAQMLVDYYKDWTEFFGTVGVEND